jgi:hypothetical protein
MSGKLTSDGVQHLADRVNNSLNGTALPETYTHVEIGTGVKGSLAAAASIALNANAAKGALSIVLKDSGGGTLTGSLIAGDVLVFGNDDTRYEVGANCSASGNLITVPLASTTPLAVAHSTGDVVTTSMGASSGDTGVRTSLAAGGRVAITTGWPKTVSTASGPAVEFKASFPAGTFSVGTAITEGAVRQSSGGGKCLGHVVFDAAQSPSASQSLDVTLQFPLKALI